MKLRLLTELNATFDKTELDKSRRHTRNAPSNREMAVVGDKKQMGHKDRIDVSIDLNQKGIKYVTHTHPIDHGPGTVLGAFPSGQDLTSSIQFAMQSGKDSISTTNVFSNELSDIEGMIIWHGAWYTVTIPTQKVDLTAIPRYEKALQSGDVEGAIKILQNMGFRFDYGYQE